MWLNWSQTLSFQRPSHLGSLNPGITGMHEAVTKPSFIQGEFNFFITFAYFIMFYLLREACRRVHAETRGQSSGVSLLERDLNNISQTDTMSAYSRSFPLSLSQTGQGTAPNMTTRLSIFLLACQCSC